jgi:hypothetical protein
MSGRYRWLKGTNDFVPVEPGYVARPRSGPILLRDYSTYTCPVTDKPIEGRHAHSENLKRRGCRLLEKGETREQGRRVEESFQAGLDRVLGSAEATMAGVGE